MSLGDQSAHSTRSCEGGRGHVGRWGGPRPPRTPPFPAFFLRGPRRPLAPPGGRDANSDCRRPPQGGGARSSLAFRSMRCPPSRREGPSAGRRPNRRGVRRSGGLGPSSSSRPRILGPIGTSILWGGGPGRVPGPPRRGASRPRSPPCEVERLWQPTQGSENPGSREAQQGQTRRESEQGRAAVPRRARRSFSTHAPGRGPRLLEPPSAVGGTPRTALSLEPQ